MAVYFVKDKETLYSIAKSHNTSVSELLKLNPAIKNNIIYPNQQIILPDAGLDLVSFGNIQPTPSKTKAGDTIPKTYVLQKGDNFPKVEKRFWLKPKQLEKANPDFNPKKLQIGQKINIPEKELYIQCIDNTDKKFNLLLLKILKDEGGLVERIGNDGKKYYVNKGITKNAYDRYIKEKAYDQKTTPVYKNVKDITDEEIKEIYYNYYYLKSGAIKEKDKKIAYWKMDTAVNCGIEKAKELALSCKNDNTKWYNARKNIYNSYIKRDLNNSKYLNGWLNRINRIKDTDIA